MTPDKTPINLPINWFDLALVVVLVLGIWRGRKRGMSEETLPVLKWLVIVLGASLAYPTISQFLVGMTPFGPLFCNVLAYLIVVLVGFMLFSLVKRALGGKLLGSDLFGKSEYYLGMGAGMVRFACVLIVGLALLNARLYTTAEIRAMHKYQNDNYGSNFFPTLSSVQSAVFAQSFTGPWIKQYCGQLLIQPAAPGGRELKRAKLDLPGN